MSARRNDTLSAQINDSECFCATLASVALLVASFSPPLRHCSETFASVRQTVCVWRRGEGGVGGCRWCER